MAIQQISQAMGGFGGGAAPSAGSGGGAAAADFADSLAVAGSDVPPTPQQMRATERAHMYARIAEVGLAAYSAEEQEKTKMLRVLAIVGAQSPPDIGSVLSGISNDMLRNPPDGLTDMYARISAAVDAIPPGGTDLHGRMQAVAKQIQQMMSDSDEDLARREKMANIVAALTPKPPA